MAGNPTLRRGLVLGGEVLRATFPLATAALRGLRRIAPAAGMAIAVLVVTVGGILAGMVAIGPTRADVGPFRAEFSITPTTHGGSELDLPPLGSVHIATHQGPGHLRINLSSLDRRRTESLVANPDLEAASVTAADDLEAGVTRMVLRTAGAALLGTLLLAGLIFRRMRRVAQAGVLALVILLGSIGYAYATFRPKAIEEPTYHGLLANAPAVVGNARRIAGDFAQYRGELQRLIANASRLYGAYSQLPVGPVDTGTIRVLHISDMHLNPAAWSVVQTTVEQFRIDVVVDTGDIVDWGTSAEDAFFVDSIAGLKVPYVYIRGNHDSAATAAAVARQPNAIVLENQAKPVAGLIFAGIGDPRFTPDKTSDRTNPQGASAINTMVLASGKKLAATIRSTQPPPDIALVHDPAAAPALAGLCPIVLAGHTHQRSVAGLQVAPGQDPTLLMVEGSTGGAGLRGLEDGQPQALELSVLYFSAGKVLQGYDDITVGGTGQTQVTLSRHIVSPPTEAADGTTATSPGR
jgi:predicted phosphodiesterase